MRGNEYGMIVVVLFLWNVASFSVGCGVGDVWCG